jgi:serine/threonine protein kinase/tetratricopeptide (TPR) repeat protein
MDIATEKWSKVKLLFEAALQQEGDARATFLEQNCSEDGLRNFVGKLVLCHERASGFLATPPMVQMSLGPECHQPTFSEGEILAGRFRTVRLIARGGMGEVYEAEDLELRGHVAIKTIRPDILHNQGSLERFKQEVHLAKQVTHPNVCRVFDLFRHQPASAVEREDIYLVSMELLRGETLSERLRRTGRMTTEAAFPIAAQIAAALDAAHDAGILHRDLKPGNVILIEKATGDARVVVTDFGLAVMPTDEFSLNLMSAPSNELVGTPAYMSPEQIEGLELTPSSDIYAFGLMLYEIVTGEIPSQAATSISIALKRLTEDPPSPRRLIPDLDLTWESAILKCIERDPNRRFSKSGDVIKALQRRRLSWHRMAKAASTALIVLCTLGVLLRLSRPMPGQKQSWWQVLRANRNGIAGGSAIDALSLPSRRSVAVLGFRDLSKTGGAGWISTALTEMFNVELTSGGKLRAITQENIARARADLRLTAEEKLSADTLSRIRSKLGADLIVDGSYLVKNDYPRGQQIRVDLQLQNLVNGEVIASVGETGRMGDLFTIVSNAVVTLREKLDLGEIPPADAESLKASMPSNQMAIESFSQGLSALRSFDLLTAHRLLETAVSAEPQFPLAYARLAETWSQLGYDTRAAAEAQKAFDLSARLSQEQRLMVEANYREITKQWDLAIEIYRRLWRFFPDDPQYGLRLASAETSAEKRAEALATLEELRRHDLPQDDVLRVDLEEAVASDVGDYRRELEASTRARKKAALVGAGFLLARASLQESYAYGGLGQEKQAIDAAVDAQHYFSAAGDKLGYARALIYEANLLRNEGNFSKRIDRYKEALSTCRAIGNKQCEGGVLNNLAGVLEDQGDLSAANREYEQSLAVRRTIDDKAGMATALNNIGTVLQLQVDLPGATKAYQEALKLYRGIGAKQGEGMVLDNLADLLLIGGDPLHAEKTMEQSLRAWQESRARNSVTADALAEMGDIHFLEGDLDGAETYYQKALSMTKSLGSDSACEEGRIQIATLWIEKDRSADAEQALRECREIFRREGQTIAEIRTDRLLLKALLRQGKLREAQSESANATTLGTKTYAKTDSLRLSIALAEVWAASGDIPRAINTLNTVLHTTNKYGLIEYSFDALLALGTIELKLGDVKGRVTLENLYVEAQRRGFQKIARDAKRVSEES